MPPKPRRRTWLEELSEELSGGNPDNLDSKPVATIRNDVQVEANTAATPHETIPQDEPKNVGPPESLEEKLKAPDDDPELEAFLEELRILRERANKVVDESRISPWDPAVTGMSTFD